MSRRPAVILASIVASAAIALFVGDRVAERAQHESGFLGVEFGPLTRAAQARAPFLTEGGALVVKVVAKSPAALARIKPGVIVTAIDGAPIFSAADAAEMLKDKESGARVTLTYLDLARGDGRRRSVIATLAAAPPESKTVYTVEPPRTLAREWDFKPAMAAHASWSNGIARGAVNPMPLKLYTKGACSALAPEDWSVHDTLSDSTAFELVSASSRSRAIFVATTVSARARVESAVHEAIAKYARIAPEPGPAVTDDDGFSVIDFGSMSGYAGFALYRTYPRGRTELALAIWIAAVPASNVAGLAPLAGAIVLSIRCDAAFAAKHRPYDPSLPPTAVSDRCLRNDCDESDFAGAYNTEMHTGYVHSAEAENFLIDPRKDIWATGPNGPGTYRQVRGLLEKLEPGRTN